MIIETFILRLSLALLQGAVIGLERQWRQKSAGLRTNTLVSLGAAAYIMLGQELVGETGDPTRIASQIITGIGFLGAGVIIKDGFTVSGLNTAATIWCSAAVGAFSGLGLWREAMVLTLAIVAVHLILRPVVLYLNHLPFTKSKEDQYDYFFSVICESGHDVEVRKEILSYVEKSNRLMMHTLASAQDELVSTTSVRAEIFASKREDHLLEELSDLLNTKKYVMQVKWEIIGRKQTDI